MMKLFSDRISVKDILCDFNTEYIALRYVVRDEWTFSFLFCFHLFQKKISLPNGPVMYTRIFQPDIKGRYKLRDINDRTTVM